MLANPTNPEWSKYSIEFCGGTHLSNTSQAEDFVIAEESGIAKGIRRIVGLTRLSAQIARRTAAGLQTRIDAMAQMSGGAELSALFKAAKSEVSVTTTNE